MQKIISFIEKNELEMRLSFYLIAINLGWFYLIFNLFSSSNFSDSVMNYSLFIPSVVFIIYLMGKRLKSSEFLLFPALRFVFFYFFFYSIIFTDFHLVILNRQKYNELDEFVIEAYNEKDNENRITLIEKIYKKLFSKNS